MTQTLAEARIDAEYVILARALVESARRDGRDVSERVLQVAAIELPEDLRPLGS